MATIQSTKPGEITGSSVLTGRTPSYRLVLKVDPQTGQYKYEYEVDDAPKAVDTIVTPPPAPASGTGGDSGARIPKGEEGSGEKKDPVSSFEQTKAALSGRQLREAQGRGPEDRGSYRDRFGTAEDQGFGFSGGTGTFRDPKFGRTGDTFTPAPGLGFAFDEFGRKRNIGVMKDIGLNVADTVGKVAGPVQDYVAGGGILGTVKNIADSITGKKEDTTVSKLSKPSIADVSGEVPKQRLGSTADLGSTRGLFSDLTPAREDIDKQIAELEERAKSPFSPRTFIANEIDRLKEQKKALDPTGKVDPGVRDTRRPDALDAPFARTVADNRATISGARQNLRDAISSRDITAAQNAAKTVAGFSGLSRDAAQRAMDQATNNASSYGNAKTGTDRRGVENIGRNPDGSTKSGSIAAERDKVGQQTADPGRTVDRSSAVSNKARANEVSDKHGNAVTNNGKAINTKAPTYKGLTQKKGAMLTRAEVKQRKAEIDAQKAAKGDKGGKKGRIICSELYRQGLISKEDYVLDLYYTSKHLTEQHTAGYWHFAVPAVKAMRRSKFWTAFWKEIAYNRLQDIKWRLGEGKFNLRGRIYSAVFEPFCYISGYFTPNSNYNELYEGEQ